MPRVRLSAAPFPFGSPVPITFRCSCGQRLSAGDEYAGKTLPCPQCGERAAIPEAAVPTKPRKRPWKHGAPQAPKPWERGSADGPDEYEHKNSRREQRSPESSLLNSGVVGGVFAMLVAVAWFVGGLAFGVFFPYPLILFFIGAFAIFKGVARAR